MQPDLYPAFVFSIILVLATAYFLLGGLPLLVLKHDVTLDSRFIRSFFAMYYRLAFWASAAAGISLLACSRYALASGMVAVALVARALRSRVGQAMEHLGSRIEQAGADAIADFRRVHLAALCVNFVQLLGLGWMIIRMAQPGA